MQNSSLVETVEQYCNQYPAPIRKRLAAIRRLVRELAPEATEKISYRMPYYALNGRLVYFAAHTHHIGVYPMPSAIKKFQSKLQPYVYAAGSIQFPHTAPFPLELIRAIIAFRVKENREKPTKVSAKKGLTAR